MRAASLMSDTPTHNPPSASTRPRLSVGCRGTNQFTADSLSREIELCLYNAELDMASACLQQQTMQIESDNNTYFCDATLHIREYDSARTNKLLSETEHEFSRMKEGEASSKMPNILEMFAAYNAFMSLLIAKDVERDIERRNEIIANTSNFAANIIDNGGTVTIRDMQAENYELEQAKELEKYHLNMYHSFKTTAVMLYELINIEVADTDKCITRLAYLEYIYHEYCTLNEVNDATKQHITSLPRWMDGVGCFAFQSARNDVISQNFDQVLEYDNNEQSVNEEKENSIKEWISTQFYKLHNHYFFLDGYTDAWTYGIHNHCNVLQDIRREHRDIQSMLQTIENIHNSVEDAKASNEVYKNDNSIHDETLSIQMSHVMLSLDKVDNANKEMRGQFVRARDLNALNHYQFHTLEMEICKENKIEYSQMQTILLKVHENEELMKIDHDEESRAKEEALKTARHDALVESHDTLMQSDDARHAESVQAQLLELERARQAELIQAQQISELENARQGELAKEQELERARHAEIARIQLQDTIQPHQEDIQRLRDELLQDLPTTQHETQQNRKSDAQSLARDRRNAHLIYMKHREESLQEYHRTPQQLKEGHITLTPEEQQEVDMINMLQRQRQHRACNEHNLKEHMKEERVKEEYWTKMQNEHLIALRKRQREKPEAYLYRHEILNPTTREMISSADQLLVREYNSVSHSTESSDCGDCVEATDPTTHTVLGGIPETENL